MLCSAVLCCPAPGYYSRYAVLRRLLRGFLDAVGGEGRRPQVLVLGAGFDTAWFQLAKDGGAEALPAKWLEVDFKEVSDRWGGVAALGVGRWAGPVRDRCRFFLLDAADEMYLSGWRAR